MILLASLMQHVEQQEENALLQIEDEEQQNEMEKNSLPTGELDFDTLSEAEVFFKNYKGREPKMFG